MQCNQLLWLAVDHLYASKLNEKKAIETGNCSFQPGRLKGYLILTLTAFRIYISLFQRIKQEHILEGNIRYLGIIFQSVPEGQRSCHVTCQEIVFLIQLVVLGEKRPSRSWPSIMQANISDVTLCGPYGNCPSCHCLSSAFLRLSTVYLLPAGANLCSAVAHSGRDS